VVDVNPECADAVDSQFKECLTPDSAKYLIGTSVIATLAYLLMLLVQLKLFAFDLEALRTIIAVTAELIVGVGAFLAALEMIQSAYTPIVEVHNELAKKAKSLPKMSPLVPPKEFDEAIEKLMPIKTFLGTTSQ